MLSPNMNAQLIITILITLTTLTEAKVCRSLPKIEANTWSEYDLEFGKSFSPIHHDLASGDISPASAGILFNDMLTKFLESKQDLQEEAKHFFERNPQSVTKLNDARKLKNLLKKKSKQKDATEDDKKQAALALRHYNFLLKCQKNQNSENEIKQQEKAFKKNFHKFAKETTNGTYGQPSVSASYSRELANAYYPQKYSTPVTIDPALLSWFPSVSQPSIPYNLSPYTPKDIKQALFKKSPSSAPGDDQIIYGFLAKMPTTHHFLATMFTKIRDNSDAPPVWGSSRIILLHKGGKTDDPSLFRMISLTANVGKLYHSLESARTLNFMIDNKYLDPSAQKAYLEGINGCVEHTQVVQEVIHHARTNHKTAHITWFDLTDAFGSVSHMLIPHVLKHYNLPPQIISYINDIYSKLEGRVVTKDWETNTFKFKKGVFQGDPYSGSIFLIVFNPLIEHIKKFKETNGYDMNGTKVITTPFADDFNLISNHKSKHQKLIKDVEIKATSMGLIFKPSKCRSLSICAGKVKDVSFVLSDPTNSTLKTHIKTMHDDPHKFLGSLITYHNTAKDYFEHFYDILKKKLENINNSEVRGEYKLSIYERYALPSMRYHLSIHDMNRNHLDKLDHLAKSFIKKWLNIQSRGVTDTSIFHPYMLNIKRPSHLYLEGHAGNHTLMRFKGDSIVNAALDSKLSRESQWTRKQSTVTTCENLLVNLVDTNQILIPNSSDTLESTQNHNGLPKAKKLVIKSVKEVVLDHWNTKVKQLTMQGQFTQLLADQKENVTWQSIIKRVPRNVLAFTLKLSTNSLPSPDNLRRWGKRNMGCCPLCSYPNGTLAHIINICPVALKQGRFTWRHDSVLSHLTTKIKSITTPNTEVFSDINGHDINGFTIPGDIHPPGGIGSKPDLVILNRSEKRIALLELTCSLQRNTENAHVRKTRKYTNLASDIESKGFKVHLLPFEVSSEGHIWRSTRNDITQTLKSFKIKLPSSTFEELSQISLLTTMSIFHAYQTTEWVSPPLLTP